MPHSHILQYSYVPISVPLSIRVKFARSRVLRLGLRRAKISKILASLNTRFVVLQEAYTALETRLIESQDLVVFCGHPKANISPINKVASSQAIEDMIAKLTPQDRLALAQTLLNQEHVTKSPRDFAIECKQTMRCNCDLDNWEPDQVTGHSYVCRIHKAAIAKYNKAKNLS